MSDSVARFVHMHLIKDREERDKFREASKMERPPHKVISINHHSGRCCDIEDWDATVKRIDTELVTR